MRDRLIKLLREKEKLVNQMPQSTTALIRLADHLLANGVIVPPVHVGGTIYTLSYGRVKEWRVYFVEMTEVKEFRFLIVDKKNMTNTMACWDFDFGKAFFLTREEAEQALAERRAE